MIDSFWIDEEMKIKAILRANSPIWYGQFNVPGIGQKRVSLKTTSKKQARIKGSKLATRIATGTYGTESDRNATVGAMIRARIARLGDLGRDAATIQIYERFYAQLVAFLPRGSDTPMSALVPATLEAFEARLREKGIAAIGSTRQPKPLKPKTLRDAMKAVRGLIRFALKRGSIHRDPSAGFDLPPGESKEIIVFTAEELAGLFADRDPDMADIWKFLVHTCLRVGEFMWLMVSDVVFDGNGRPKALLVRKKKCPFTGKQWKPKHGVERVVPLTSEAADIVAAAIECSNGTWLFEFNEARGKQPGKWGYNSLLHRLAKRLKDIGAPRRGLHTLRHTGATHLANDARMPLAQLQKFLGHSDIKTTMCYMHPNADDIAQSMAAVDYGKLIGQHRDNTPDCSDTAESSEPIVEDPNESE